MGEIHKLRVKSPYELMKIVDIRIENKPNTHGYLYLKCLIDEKVNFNATIKASTEDEISVYEETENTEDENKVNINTVDESKSKILFNGIVQNIRTSNESGIYYLEIQALTWSFKLDIKKKSRSFQNINMTYEILINEIFKDYSGYSFINNIEKDNKINKPLFQYKETDWDFLKRISSELKSELYCDMANKNNMFNLGIPKGRKYELNNDLEYSIYKDIKKFYESGGDNSKYNDIDYLYYEIKTKEIFEIGSEVTYNQKDFYVREYEANNKKEEIVYKYKLCRKEGVWQNIIYNNQLKGATIEGKVIEVKDELVKIHLDIDKNQSKSEANWFSYAPPSVNIMYSMPLVGEKVRLYFQNNMDENPIIIGCVRNNGDSCTKTSNPNKRYFETEHGNEIAMLEDSLKLKNGHKKGISINFDDNIGVHLKSSQKLKLDADKEIIIKTRKRVKINAANKILMIKRNKSHGVSIEGEFYIKGDNVIINGSDRETYSSLVDGGEK